MGLAENIQKAISSGVKSFDTIRKLVTYHSSGTFEYNPTTGNNVESGSTEIENLYVIFTSYKLEDIDNEIIHKEDKKILIPTNDISITPKDSDYVLTESGTERWDIKDKKVDPANSLWTLQARKHKNI